MAKFKQFLENFGYRFVNDFVGRIVLKEIYQLSKVDMDGGIVCSIKYSVLDGIVEVIESDFKSEESKEDMLGYLRSLHPDKTVIYRTVENGKV